MVQLEFPRQGSIAVCHKHLYTIPLYNHTHTPLVTLVLDWLKKVQKAYNAIQKKYKAKAKAIKKIKQKKLERKRERIGQYKQIGPRKRKKKGREREKEGTLTTRED